MSMNPSAIFRWPVEETARNSGPPSTTPRMAASRTLIVVVKNRPRHQVGEPGTTRSVADACLVQSLDRDAQGRDALLEILQHRRNGQCGDPRLGERLHAVRDALTRSE